MSKKTLIILLIIGIIIFSILTGMYIYKISNKKQENNYYVKRMYDSQTIPKEENTLKIENDTINANSSEEKITPNTRLVLRKYYEKCGHSVNEYVELPAELINMTKEELSEQYKDWEIYVFSEKEVILIKTINDNCNEHYKLKELDGYIAVYKINKDGKEELQEKTSISTRYLTQTDISHLNSEIEIYGIENLNKYLEDFE